MKPRVLFLSPALLIGAVLAGGAACSRGTVAADRGGVPVTVTQARLASVASRSIRR